jgi:RNA-directed DNA polymerase
MGGAGEQDKALRDFQVGCVAGLLKVKANGSVGGVDEQSIKQFEQNLRGNLYKLWNRLSSGSYFPPPVKLMELRHIQQPVWPL